MKIFSLTFLISLLLIFPVYGQLSETINDEDLREFTTDDVVRSHRSTVVKGSPFLIDEWAQGKVFISENTESENVPLRFDTHNNQLQFLRNDNVYVMDSNKIDGFEIHTQTENILFRNGFKSEEYDIDRSTLLRILTDGNTKFVVYHTTSLNEDVPTYGTANRTDQYVNDETYFIVKDDGSFERVRLRKRHITRALSDMDDRIEQFADDRNLSFRDENHVALIVEKFNEWKYQDGNS